MANPNTQTTEARDSVSEVTALWEDYENGLTYQQSSGLAKNLPTFVNFYEGKQWAAPTKNTKNLPQIGRASWRERV